MIYGQLGKKENYYHSISAWKSSTTLHLQKWIYYRCTGYSITAILETIECNGSRECNKGNIREIGSNVNTNKKVLEFGKIEANPLPAPHPLRFSSRLWISSDLKIHKSGHSTQSLRLCSDNNHQLQFHKCLLVFFSSTIQQCQKYLQMCIQFDTSSPSFKGKAQKTWKQYAKLLFEPAFSHSLFFFRSVTKKGMVLSCICKINHPLGKKITLIALVLYPLCKHSKYSQQEAAAFRPLSLTKVSFFTDFFLLIIMLQKCNKKL